MFITIALLSTSHAELMTLACKTALVERLFAEATRDRQESCHHGIPLCGNCFREDPSGVLDELFEILKEAAVERARYVGVDQEFVGREIVVGRVLDSVG